MIGASGLSFIFHQNGSYTLMVANCQVETQETIRWAFCVSFSTPYETVGYDLFYLIVPKVASFPIFLKVFPKYHYTKFVFPLEQF